MGKKECIAMLLAGGRGSRLKELTSKVAKPAVSFGGKYHIIDFPLSNCANSGINTVGVLTQYRPYELHQYVGSGEAWDLNERGSGVSVLPPFETQSGASWYAGTADAITQNLDYVKANDPEYVLILSGDHLYRMDYADMLANHKANDADLTVSVMPVPWEEASRFGILTTDPADGRIVKFTEKPAEPDSNLASMGIYIFTASTLIKALEEDAVNPDSSHDFGNDIIPKLLGEGKRLFTYEFRGYWKDVGTIASYHEASMELLGDEPAFDPYQADFPVMSNISTLPPQYVGKNAVVEDCLVSNGVQIFGSVKHSIVSDGCYIGEGAVVEDAVLLPGSKILAGAQVARAILGDNAVVEEGVAFGSADPSQDIAVAGNDDVIGKEA